MHCALVISHVLRYYASAKHYIMRHCKLPSLPLWCTGYNFLLTRQEEQEYRPFSHHSWFMRRYFHWSTECSILWVSLRLGNCACFRVPEVTLYETKVWKDTMYPRPFCIQINTLSETANSFRSVQMMSFQRPSVKLVPVPYYLMRYNGWQHVNQYTIIIIPTTICYESLACAWGFFFFFLVWFVLFFVFDYLHCYSQDLATHKSQVGSFPECAWLPDQHNYACTSWSLGRILIFMFKVEWLNENNSSKANDEHLPTLLVSRLAWPHMARSQVFHNLHGNPTKIQADPGQYSSNIHVCMETIFVMQKSKNINKVYCWSQNDALGPNPNIGHHCDGRNFFSQLSFLSEA